MIIIAPDLGRAGLEILKTKIAKIVSTVGNPLILSFLVVLIVNFHEYELNKALQLSGILLAIGILPIWFYIHKKVKEGKFTDHDVSARTKRTSLYQFALIFLGLMVLALYFTKQENEIVFGALAAWFLALFSFIINFKIKSSLHTGYAFLIAWLVLGVNIYFFWILFVFAIFVAWSRVSLKRHSVNEVLLGAFLGSVVGIVYQLYFHQF